MQPLRSWIVAAWCVLMVTASARADAAGATTDAPASIEEAASPAAPEPATPATAPEAAPAAPPVAAPARGKDGGPARVKVIPVRDVIAKPVLYVIRRGLKEAQASGMNAVVIDMDTPGGQLGVTLEIMEALDKFEGETLVYVNKEAISAGAIISSVADEIHFAPGGVIGAAAAVSGGGEEIAETMKQKINSYMNAKVRAFNSGKGYRAEVIRAMMDADYEFKIGDALIKPKGELLSLTDVEAAKLYGEPGRALLSSGTHATVEDLLAAKYGKAGYAIDRVEVTWSEELASWISSISPVLMGLGLLCVFIEFKTPGFGVFGIAGGLMLALVFFGHYAAGLSGHEPAIFFAVGVALVLLELLVVPGTLVAGLTGGVLMLGALVWSMVDVWPDAPVATNFGGDALLGPLLKLLLGLMVAFLGAVLVWGILPRGWFFNHIALTDGAGVPSDINGTQSKTEIADLLGCEGVVVTALMPSGQVDVGGRRYDARTEVGVIDAGARVRVVARKDFDVIVEKVAI